MPFTATATGRIEYERIHVAEAAGPTVVMLHERLGSVAMWKNFPREFAQATRSTVAVYSRYGYGRSERLYAPRSVRYMHHKALVVLPEFLEQLGIERPILFGHSDGARLR